MKLSLIILTAAVIILTAKCNDDSEEGSIVDDGEEFNYSQGGLDWEDYDCQFGIRQSPIDFPFYAEDIISPIPRDFVRYLQATSLRPPQVFKALHQLTFEAKYGEIADVEVENMTDTIRIAIRHIDGSLVIHEDGYDDQVFYPAQFHFHSPSEHTIDGRHYDLEMHFYHETLDGSHHSVIALFFDRKSGGNYENPFITNLFTTPNNESTDNEATWTPIGVHLESLLLQLDRNQLFHYEGSLTVPPCSENVEWNIINDPQPISQEQLDIFLNKWPRNPSFANGRGNNRRTQLLKQRQIYYMLGRVLSHSLLIGTFLVFILF